MIYLAFAAGVMVGVMIAIDWKIRKLDADLKVVARNTRKLIETGKAEFYEPESPEEILKKAENIQDLIR